MKYILPIAVSLIFTACNDSNTSSTEKLSSNSTVIEQAITNVKQEEPKIEQAVTKAEVEEPKVEQTVAKAEAEKPKVQQPQAEVAAKVEVNGEMIFSKCKSCHGNSAEKRALGTSQIIKGWEIAKIEKALRGYKEGTYGREMKNIMSAQAKALSDEEIKKVAVYIHSL